MPPIKTTLVGSYPVPRWLQATPSRDSLRDAMAVVIKTQELAGVDLLVDGELSRFDFNHPETNGMIEYFLGPMSGVSTTLTRDDWKAFHSRSDMQFRAQPAAVVTDDIGAGTLNLEQDYLRLQALTERPTKFTVTAPYMLAQTLFDRHYPDLQSRTMALGHVLADAIRDINANTIQVDEASLTGHPQDCSWAHEPINLVLDAVANNSALHLCFGNYGGQRVQAGFWEDMVPFLNNLHVGSLILEFARRGYDELEVFKDVRPDIALGIGVIDIKDLEIEPPDTVASRIERAVSVLGAERVAWVHPDCGFWMLPRNVADGKIQALVAGRDLYCGTRSA